MSDQQQSTTADLDDQFLDDQWVDEHADEHEEESLWWDSCFDEFNPEWDELRSRQSDFAVMRALANTPVDYFRESLTDPDERNQSASVVKQYGPLWRYAQIVWLPPVSTYDYNDSCMSWQTSQSAVLLRSDLIPELNRDESDELAMLSVSVRQAVGEALQVWAQQHPVPVATITNLLDDFYGALYAIPVTHLWEAGVVPAVVSGRVRMMYLDHSQPWLPESFRVYSRDTQTQPSMA